MKSDLLELLMAVSKALFRIAVVQVLAMNLLIASSSGQSLEEIYVSLQVRNATLESIFHELEHQSGFAFTYEARLIRSKQHHSASYRDATFRDVLLDLSEDHYLSFRRVNDVVYVASRRNEALSEQVVEFTRTISLSGKVLDAETGEGLIGATIRVKDSPIGTVTNLDGEFQLDVPEEARTLIFTYIGYEELAVDLDGSNNLIISLQPSSLDLGEVVVIGYTASKPKDFTGSIASIGADEVNKMPVSSVEQALQGQVAGVHVTNDGAPGGASAVRIRGYGTIGNNDPLYIIDGVPTKSGLNQFSNFDIENIQVLKDASATALYGSRAANGVIVINTKKGQHDGYKISFDTQVGIQQPTNLPNMLKTQDYADLLWQAQRNSGITPSNDLFGNGENPVIPEFIDDEQLIPAALPGTDWFDEVFEPALFQSYNLSISSGRPGLKNFTSLFYQDQQGIMEYTGFEKYGFRTNTEIVAGRLKVGENFTLAVTNTQSVPTNQALGSRMIHTYRINPVVPVFDINGDFAGPVNGVQGALNPVGLNFLDRNDRTLNNRLFGNIFLELELLEGLHFKSTFGIDYADINIKDYDPQYKMGITERGETSFFQAEQSNFQYVWNNTLQYKLKWGEHNFAVIAGQEAIKFTTNQLGGTASDFVTDEIDFIQLNTGNGQSSNFSDGTEWALLSFFGRVDYQWQDTYLFSASVRRDGSSRFSDANRYGTFPAFSAGWRLSNESFMSAVPWVNQAKLRVSWGQSGNQEIGDFPSFSTFSANAWDTYYSIDGANDRATIGFKPTRIGNPDVKWETTTQTDIGLDLRLFDAIDLTMDYFIKTTDDILLQRPTLAIEGQADAPFVNLGEMQNKGFELNLGYSKAYEGGLSFGMRGNVSVVRNKVTRLADDVVQLTGLVSNTFSRNLILSVTEVSQPIAQFYGHVVDGIFQTQQEVMAHAEQEGKGIGRLKFRDINSDGVVDDNDRTFIGNPHPDFIYGATFNVAYRDFDLSIFMQGVQGVDLYNFTRYYTDFYYDLGNRHTRVLDAWSPTNTNTDIPLLAAVDVNNELRPSTYFIEDGSYLRVRNVELGYNVPLKSEFLTGVRVYAQAQNLFTFTKYEGIDPEVGIVNLETSQRNLDLGVDRGIYPNSRILLLGLNITL